MADGSGDTQVGAAASARAVTSLPEVTLLPDRGQGRHSRSQSPSCLAKATNALPEPPRHRCGAGGRSWSSRQHLKPLRLSVLTCAGLEQTAGQGTRALSSVMGQKQPRNVWFLFQCSWPHSQFTGDYRHTASTGSESETSTLGLDSDQTPGTSMAQGDI